MFVKSHDSRRQTAVVLVAGIILLSAMMQSMPLVGVVEAKEKQDLPIENDSENVKPDRPEPSKKFEKGFYDKIKSLEKAKEDRDYTVTIFVKDPTEMGDRPGKPSSVEDMKDRLKDILVENHKASFVQKAEVLSFVTAKLPISEVSKLASYDFINLVGDTEKPGKVSGMFGGQEIDIPDVQIGNSEDVELSPSKPATSIQADMNTARSTVNGAGLSYTGSGIRVAVIDTGIRQNHPDLPVGTKIIEQTDCTSGTCTTGTYDDPANHGTHVAGIIASTGNQNSAHKGLAPGALILNARMSVPGTLPQAIDWALTKDAKVIVSTWNDGSCVADQEFSGSELAIDEAIEKRGVVIVATMANFDGHYVSHSSCAFNVISVGAIDDRGSTDVMWSGSNVGPAFDGGTTKRIKPDIVAPGVLIKSADRCTISGSDYNDKNYFYAGGCQSTPNGDITGTSFAAPMVAAAAAVLFEKNPTWASIQVKAALKQAAASSLSSFPSIQSQPESVRGAGVLNIAGALAITNPDVATHGYGMDLSTYKVQSTGTQNPTVEYTLAKETSFSQGISANGGMFRQSSSATQKKIFDTISVPSIKVDGSSQTLSDSNMYAGPRIDLTPPNKADLYVTYKVGTGSNEVKIKQTFFITNTAVIPQVRFEASSSHSYEIIQYSDFDIVDTLDRARPTPTGTPYPIEAQLTNTQFYIRDTTTSVPYLQYNPGTPSPTQWIVKLHTPTNNPGQHLTSENIDPADFVVDYKASTSGSGSKILGPDTFVRWGGGLGIYAESCNGDYIDGMAVSLYDSNSNLIQSGYTPMYVDIHSTGNYVLKYSNYGNNKFVSAEPSPIPVTSYVQHTGWGGDVNLSLSATEVYDVDGIYNTNNQYSCSASSNGAINVKSTTTSGTTITGMYMQLTDLSNNQLDVGWTEHTFSNLSPGSYKVWANDYCNTQTGENRVFSQWNDGTTTRDKTVSVTAGTTSSITARYTITTC